MGGAKRKSFYGRNHIFLIANIKMFISFLALRFIQRFGISNPSPGYIGRVAESFIKGEFTFSDQSSDLAFGSGSYGDLAATVASILLDRESRSILLDLDPFHGSLREPLIKVIALMRNLDYESNEKFISFRNMKDLIGQMVRHQFLVPIGPIPVLIVSLFLGA